MSFRALHVPGDPMVMPNPWDVGSAVMLQNLGAIALASTSAGSAFAQGRPDGALSLEQMLDAADAINRATDVPVSADLENGGGAGADQAAIAIRRAADLGLAGASIEDYSGDDAHPIYPFDQAVERVEASVEAARMGGIVLTARAEALLTDQPDFEDVLRRIRAFAAAGADVVFAPGLKTAEDVRAVVAAAGDTPVSVLIGGNAPDLTVARLASLGVARISLGSGLARAAYGAMIAMMRDAMAEGRFDYPETTAGFADITTLLR